ncbi:MAG: adenylate/guanylate cyclase domain-containing protein, partial [Anderseniella sp.]|nr:adenylate/guanylate cyclase domain-containing protein [Anderseniella sp.]
MERRLAAILAADVAGYSRLMSADEAGTLAAVNSCLSQVLEPSIAEHGGHVFKRMGDGLLAEFPSVVRAVACAAEIQDGMTRRENLDGQP